MLSETIQATFKDAVKKLTGHRKSVEAALQWAGNMTWKGIAPLVELVTTTYQTGVKVLSDELERYTPFWQRSETLPNGILQLCQLDWYLFCPRIP